MNAKPTTPKLSLRRESLRELTTTELRNVAAGLHWDPTSGSRGTTR